MFVISKKYSILIMCTICCRSYNQNEITNVSQSTNKIVDYLKT